MKTIYIEPITELKKDTLKHLESEDYSIASERRKLSDKFFVMAKKIGSLEEKEMLTWLKGTSGDIMYYGDTYDSNPEEYKKLIEEIIDHLDNLLP